MLCLLNSCLVITEMQYSYISFFVEVNLLIQIEKDVSKNDPSKNMNSFLPSLQIRSCGVRRVSGNNHSSQHGNAAMHLLRYYLSSFSTLIRLLETQAWLTHVRAFLSCSTVMCTLNLSMLWQYRIKFIQQVQQKSLFARLKDVFGISLGVSVILYQGENY